MSTTTKLTFQNISYEVNIETITPEIAEKYLATIKNERKLSLSHVNTLCARMMSDHWFDLNGDTIRFDWYGHLCDGQHRLWMVIKTNIPIVTFVIRGLDPKCFLEIDTDHKRRSVDDVLSGLGYTNCTTLAALLRTLRMYQLNRVSIIGAKGWGEAAQKSFDVLFAQCLIGDHPFIEMAVGRAIHYYRKQKMSIVETSIVAFYTYALPFIDVALAEEFVEMLVGIRSAIGTPVDPLLSRLALSRKAGVGKGRLSLKEIYAITHKAWNCFVLGQHVETFRSISWKYNETFPSLRGQDGKERTYDDFDWKQEKVGDFFKKSL